MSNLLNLLKEHLNDDIIINYSKANKEDFDCADFTNKRTGKTFGIYGDDSVLSVKLSSLLKAIEMISNDKTDEEIADEAMKEEIKNNGLR